MLCYKHGGIMKITHLAINNSNNNSNNGAYAAKIIVLLD